VATGGAAAAAGGGAATGGGAAGAGAAAGAGCALADAAKSSTTAAALPSTVRFTCRRVAKSIIIITVSAVATPPAW
jgi:hypothetical protein